jgi:Tol biopolymer transport system component
MRKSTTTLLAAAMAGAGALGASTASATIAWVSTAGGSGGNAPIVVAGDDGTNPVQVTRGSQPVLSPDGRRMAFQVVTRSSAAWRVMDIASRTVVPVAPGCSEFGGARWTPDSTRFVCGTVSTRRGGEITGQGLAMAQVPAALVPGTPVPLTTLIPARGNNAEPPPQGVSFSPDGTLMAFATSAWNTPTSVYVAPVAAPSQRTRVLANAIGPVWGPASLAATRVRNTTVRVGRERIRTVQQNVWVVQPDGSGARAITSFRTRGLVYGPYALFWTPDGATIVGGIGGQDYMRTATFAIATRRTTTLQPRTDTFPVAVSADGQYIAFQPSTESSRFPLRMVRIDGTGARTIARNAAMPSFSAAWKP